MGALSRLRDEAEQLQWRVDHAAPPELMDRQTDFKGFQMLMDQLCALRGQKEAANPFVNAYWDALKDRPYSEIETNVKRWIANATKDTAFPRPRELRSHAPSGADPIRTKAERDSIRNWQEMKARDPVKFTVEYNIALAARELAGLDEGDPGYDEWLRTYQRWTSIRYAPRAEQQAAIARFGGST